MVTFLLLLLLHESQTEQVWLDITGHTMNISLADGHWLDHTDRKVACQTFLPSPCYFECTTYNKNTWFNGSSACLEANVTKHALKTVYEIYNYSTCTENLCNNTRMLEMMESLNCERCGRKEIILLNNMRDSCTELFSKDEEVKKKFIKLENQLIHNIMGYSNVKPGSYKCYDMKVLFLNVSNISDAAFNSSETNDSIQIEAPRLLPENISFIPEVWLPVSALKNASGDNRIIGLVAYKQHRQFQFQQEKILSKVLRIEVLQKQRLQNLEPPIRMIFKLTTHQYTDNDLQLQCHYFDEEDAQWKPDGCETVNSNLNQTTVSCHCNHATAFAVLLVRMAITEVHWKILSYISYIGCGLSAFFAALSLVIYVFSRKYKLDHSISIHVSLSAALFLMNSTFLLTESGARAQQEWVCVFVAAFMHYSLLCCFTWMAIEGLHLYLLLIKVFNAHYKHYLLKLSLAGWGIPGVIVSVFLGVRDFKQFYGLTEIKMADTNQTSSICWITDDTFFYSLNLLYFSLVFVFNSGILVAVASSICRMKQVLKRKAKVGADTEKFSASCRTGLNVLGLTCLMGTTWGLAFLGSGYVNYPILYLFCILNSTQGFFLFLWILLSTKKQRQRDLEDRTSSSPMKTSDQIFKSD